MTKVRSPYSVLWAAGRHKNLPPVAYFEYIPCLLYVRAKAAKGMDRRKKDVKQRMRAVW